MPADRQIAIWNGAIHSKPVLLKKSKYRITIAIMGTPAATVFPHMNIYINGNKIADFFVTDKIKGRQEAEHQRLLEDAKLLADAGAFAMVLELVTPPVAKEISEMISIPTIGIGSGPDCDGQILVTPDLIGSFPWFTPKFVKPKVNCAGEIKSAVTAWKHSLTVPKG